LSESIFIPYYIYIAPYIASLIPDGGTLVFNWHNHSSSTINLGLIQHLTEMSARNLPGGKGWQVRKTDNLTTKIWGLDVSQPHGRPQRVTVIHTLECSTKQYYFYFQCRDYYYQTRAE
jgi:hypothetical protein